MGSSASSGALVSSVARVARSGRPLLLTAILGVGMGCNGEIGSPSPTSEGSGARRDSAGSTPGTQEIPETDPGSVVMHRLNATEYNNTVRDLLNSSIRLPPGFPPDDTAYGFDNVAEALNLTDVHLGYYLATAKDIAEEALGANHRGNLLTCDLATQKEACAETTLRTFLPRAWRRPVTAGEVSDLVALYTAVKADSGTDDEALGRVLQAALVAPQFLFRVEPNASARNAPRTLDSYELASRLSYFLWSSMPDEELFRAASDGSLTDTANLKQQAHRMLASPKATSLVDGFGGQWLTQRDLDRVTPNAMLYPAFDDELRSAMHAETAGLFAEIASGIIPVDQLLTPTFSYLNDRLAAHYGLPPVGSSSAVRTIVPTQRGGLLTNASILSVLAHPKETAPVLRGKWILSQLLCHEIPPPPPNVPQEPTAMQSQSRRERLASHRVMSTCVTCHSLMDPLGLALEQYDAIGAFRTSDNGVPIVTADRLPDGRSFAGAQELERVIAADPDFASCVTDHVFTYGLGRPKREGNDTDEKLVQAVTASFVGNGKKFPDLLESVVLSYTFRNRQDEVPAPPLGGAP